MGNYKKLDSADITYIKEIVKDEERVLTGDFINEEYSHDELGGTSSYPDVVVRAKSPEEIAAIMKYAYEHTIPVTPRGAGTGLVGSSVAIEHGILSDTTLLNHILVLDEDNLSVTVECGVLLMELGAYVEEHDFFYPPDPGEKSATIGGNISTNAGGMRAVKYGVTRDYVMGLEVVLPNGEITQFGGKVVKNSSGYDLKDQIIGSEGTQGIITKATLKLLPKPRYKLDLLAVFDDTAASIGVVNKIIKAGITPTCVEFMDNITIKSVERYLNETLQGSDTGNYLIVEVEGTSEDDLDDKAIVLDELCTASGASSVLVADPARIWQARKAFAEAVRAESLIVCKEDVVVPVDQEPRLLARILELARKYGLITRIASHAGDGNIHLNILKNEDLTYEQWEEKISENQQELYRFIYQLGGRLSGEHGIGSKRKALMEEFTNPDELAMMRSIQTTSSIPEKSLMWNEYLKGVSLLPFYLQV